LRYLSLGKKWTKIIPPPFKWIWNFLSGIASVAGLASLADSIIKINGFVNIIIETYQSIFYPIFEFVFSYFSFNPPHYFYDYLIIGALIISSHIQALKSVDSYRGHGHSRLIPSDFIFDRHVDTVSVILGRLLFWPLLLLEYLIKNFTLKFDEEAKTKGWTNHFEEEANPRYDSETLKNQVKRMVKFEYSSYLEHKRFFQWLGTILLIAISLIIGSEVYSYYS